MYRKARGAGALGAALLLGGMLLAGAPGATAATASVPAAPRAEAVATLSAPKLTSATVKGDNVVLLFTPPAGGGVFDYAIHADGAFVFRTGGAATSATVYLTAEGLTGREVYTVVAEDSALNPSPPSNGLVPVAPAELPAPHLTSASLSAGTVTLRWTASHTDEPSGVVQYYVHANGAFLLGAGTGTTATFPLDGDVDYFLRGDETLTVVAHDRTLAESQPSNGLVPTAG